MKRITMKNDKTWKLEELQVTIPEDDETDEDDSIEK